MSQRMLIPVGLLLTLTACASVDGVYLPSCEAYAGSEIRLEDGRFHWSRFTDQVVIDEEGNKVDPFPGYPLEGVYQVSGGILTLVPDDGESPQVLYIQQEGKDIYLLNAAEKGALDASGEPPQCALQRQAPGT